MATVTAPWWLWWVLGGLVAAGAVAVCWVAASWAERAADWWHARQLVRHLSREDDPAPCGLCGSVAPCEHDEYVPPLPPERTWEQMTSHQLPLEPGAADHFLRPPGYLAAVRERRVPSWEVDQRQHYAAMGFEFPSGLMARVREAAQ